MKLLFDQNLSHRLVPRLSAEYPLSQHVRDVGLVDATDPAIWQYAKQHGFVVVSKDVDFQQRALLLGHPPKIVWLRVGNASTTMVEDLLRNRHTELLAFEADATGAFLVLS